MDDDIRVIRQKVEMLNDWHHMVDARLAVIDERLKWILRIAVALACFGLGDRAIPLISKLFGG